MNRILSVALLSIIIMAPLRAWCGLGHRTVHSLALHYLESDSRAGNRQARSILSLLKPNEDFFVTQADLADRVRNVNRSEAPNHYLDLEDYGGAKFLGSTPLNRPGGTSAQSGTLPWRIVEMVEQLRLQIRRKDFGPALRTAAFLGHYVGDAHVPLHTTRHHDGRDKSEKGIHSRWETRTVKSMDALGLLPRAAGPARPRAIGKRSILRAASDAILASHKELPAVFAADAKARAVDPDCGDAYLSAMRKSQGDLIRSRLTEAGRLLADLLLMAADTTKAERFVVRDETRLDFLKANSTGDAVEFSLLARRLGPASRSPAPMKIVVLGLPKKGDPASISTTAISLAPEESASLETRIKIPRSVIDKYPRLEIRLEPFDKFSPEDNRLRMAERDWLEPWE